MNILIVSYYDYESGGTGVSTYQMANGLKKRGHNVYVASLKKFPGIKTFIFRNFRFLPLFVLRDLYLSWFIGRIFKNNKIDIIHVSDYRFSLMGSYKFAKTNGIPIVVHLRDYWFKCLKGDLLFRNKEQCSGMKLEKCLSCLPKHRTIWERYKYKYFQKKLNIISDVNAVVAVSDFVSEEMKAINRDVEVEVVYDFFDKESFVKVENKNIFGEKYENKTKILFAGMLIYHKGINQLLEVAKMAMKENSNLVFFVAGDGEGMEKCEKFIENNGLNNIVFLGRVKHEQMSSLYNYVDIVYFPSILSEPLGRTVIEAMGCGKVVIASNIGGIKEIIEENETGILVEPFDVKQHLEKIFNISKNPKTRLRIGINAKERSLDFSSEKVSMKIEGIYNKILKK